MSTAIQKFVNEKFNWEIRVVEIDGEVWLVGKDAATALGYKDTDKALRDHVPDKFKLTRQISGSGQKRNMTLINEAGLYKLIMRSKLPDAEKFSDWVCGEVLPSIRKHGFYATPDKTEEIISNPDAFIEQLIQNYYRVKSERDELKGVVETQKTQIADLEVKSSYCKKVLQCDSLVPISVIAKDYGYSAVAFNRLLNDLGVQYKQGNIWLLYQEYADLGWTQSKTYVYDEENNKCSTHTYWTQEGRLGLYQFLKDNNILPVIEQ